MVWPRIIAWLSEPLFACLSKEALPPLGQIGLFNLSKEFPDNYSYLVTSISEQTG